MKYALLIYTTQHTSEESPSEADSAAVHDEYMAIAGEPGCVGGAHLQPVETATTVRLADGQTLVTDGPFADTKEVFAGFFLVDAENLDDATAVAARIPAVRFGGSVEVRPIVEM